MVYLYVGREDKGTELKRLIEHVKHNAMARERPDLWWAMTALDEVMYGRNPTSCVIHSNAALMRGVKGKEP